MNSSSTGNVTCLDWANRAADILAERIPSSGIILALGASDTGKTTLIFALAKKLSQNFPVAIVDSDLGQSRIGPPSTVGWSIVEKSDSDLSSLPIKGLAFVGDITPQAHLLQFTAALIKCTSQALKSSKMILIDTPGFIAGSAAAALWWSVTGIFRPEVLLCIQRENELQHILSGIKGCVQRIELLQCLPDVTPRSSAERRLYRKAAFDNYFRNSKAYDISMNDFAVQTGFAPIGSDITGRLIALMDKSGNDLAIGLVTHQRQGGAITIKAPPIDMNLICCLVIGDSTLDLDG